MSDPILEDNNSALITASEARSMASWSDQKRTDFIHTFEERTGTAAIILAMTAQQIQGIAYRRKFISSKHTNKIKQVTSHETHRSIKRNWQELQDIAHERAKAVLSSLPSLKQAVSVIDSVTAERLEELERVNEKLQQLKDTLDELSEPINMAEVDQSMTIGTFRDEVRKRIAKKEAVLSQMREEGRKSQELDMLINKALYAGIPGLSEAVIAVINEHYERVTGLGNMTRRVAERVKFGDSPEALSLLEHFEKDEVTVSDNIKSEFNRALEVLNLSKKQLKASKTVEKTPAKTPAKTKRKK